MIVQLVDIRKVNASNIIMVGRRYLKDGTLGPEVLRPSGEMSKKKVRDLMEVKEGLKGKDFAFITNANGKYIKNDFYILFDMYARCDLGPNAEEFEGDIEGKLLETGSGVVHIETIYDDRYVVCYTSPEVIEERRKACGKDSLTYRPGFYSHETGKAYLGCKVN